MGLSSFSNIIDIISVIDCTNVKNDLKTNFKFQVGNHWNYLLSYTVQHGILEVLNDTDQNLIAKRIKLLE